MTGWTKEDTRALRAQGRCLDCAVDPSLAHDHSAELEQRAADEIERLQARVARLEREYECHPNGGVPGCDCWECLRTRIATLEAERDVLNGAWCAENQAEGRGPCGACVTCLRQGTPRAVQEAVDAATGPLRKRIAALEAERAEVARELRRLAEYVLLCEMPRTAHDIDALAARLERKGE